MELNNDVLTQIVCKVIQNLKQETTQENRSNGIYEKDASGIINVKAAAIRPEPFDTGTVGQKVYLTDVLNPQESPKLGCGLIEIDRSTYEWKIKADEINYIIEGSLEIVIDGRTICANKGDIVYLPKGSQVQFKSVEYSRMMCVNA